MTPFRPYVLAGESKKASVLRLVWKTHTERKVDVQRAGEGRRERGCRGQGTQAKRAARKVLTRTFTLLVSTFCATKRGACPRKVSACSGKGSCQPKRGRESRCWAYRKRRSWTKPMARHGGHFGSRLTQQSLLEICGTCENRLRRRVLLRAFEGHENALRWGAPWRRAKGASKGVFGGEKRCLGVHKGVSGEACGAQKPCQGVSSCWYVQGAV